MEFLNLLGVTTVSDLVVVITIMVIAIFLAGWVFGHKSSNKAELTDNITKMPPTLMRRK